MRLYCPAHTYGPCEPEAKDVGSRIHIERQLARYSKLIEAIGLKVD